MIWPEGIWTFVLLLLFAIGFISLKLGVAPWKLWTFQHRMGFLVEKEPAVSEAKTLDSTGVVHVCTEKDCRFWANQSAYTKYNVTAEVFWMDHWMSKHDTLSPVYPYVEVILKSK